MKALPVQHARNKTHFVSLPTNTKYKMFKEAEEGCVVIYVPVKIALSN